MKGWAVIVGILILGVIISSGCTQTASSPSTLTPTLIQPTPLVTEQTSRPPPQPTVEVTKAMEKSLPLTESYTNDKYQFSLSLPEGWTVMGNKGESEGMSGVTEHWAPFYIVKKTFADNNSDARFNATGIPSYPNVLYPNSAIYLEMGLADDYSWRNVVTRFHGNSTVVEDVYIGNSIKAKKITFPKNITPCNYFSDKICEQYEGAITYVTVDRTSKGFMLWVEYRINPQLDDKPIETFNPATYDEIIKSLKIVKVKP